MTTQLVRNYLSGVKYLHISMGFDFPFYEAPELKLTLCGLEHLVKHAPSRAPPVTRSLLWALVQCSSSALAEESVFWCAFLFAFYLFARISNLVPTLAKSFDPTKHLCRGDIVVTSFGLRVTFKWCKTNQSSAKPLTLPLHSVSDPLLCPVRAYLHMCWCLPAPAAAPSFFTTRRSGSYTVVTKAQFVAVFRDRLARIGVPNPARFRGHSFRRGGATWACRYGIPDELIQIYGDWASDAYKSYLEFSEDAKLTRSAQHGSRTRLLEQLLSLLLSGGLAGREVFCRVFSLFRVFLLYLFLSLNLSLCQTESKCDCSLSSWVDYFIRRIGLFWAA